MIKMSRCAEELKRINQNVTRVAKKSHDEIASEMGISRQTFERYLNLSKTIPEIQNLIQDGKVSPEVGRKIFKFFQIKQSNFTEIVHRTSVYTQNRGLFARSRVLVKHLYP